MTCCGKIQDKSLGVAGGFGPAQIQVEQTQSTAVPVGNVLEIPIAFDFKRKDLTKGRYKFYFNIETFQPETAVWIRDNLKKLEGGQYNIIGKQIKVNSIDFDKKFKYIVADITIITNPIPISVIITALTVLAGLVAGYLVLEKVEKILEVSPEFLVLLIVALIVIMSFITRLASR